MKYYDYRCLATEAVYERLVTAMEQDDVQCACGAATERLLSAPLVSTPLSPLVGQGGNGISFADRCKGNIPGGCHDPVPRQFR